MVLTKMSQMKLYKARTEHMARNSAEINLTDSDILVNVTYEGKPFLGTGGMVRLPRQRQNLGDGLARGTNITTSEMGFFPVTMVEPVRQSSIEQPELGNGDVSPGPDTPLRTTTETQTSIYITKKRKKKIPLKQRCQNWFGFSARMVISLLCASGLSALLFLLLYYQYDFPLSAALVVALLCSAVTTVLFTFSVQARCVVLVMIPGLCTSRGRAALLAFILSMTLSTSGNNVAHNVNAAADSFDCYLTLYYNNTARQTGEIFQQREIRLIERVINVTKEASQYISKLFSSEVSELSLKPEFAFDPKNYFNTSHSIWDIKDEVKEQVVSVIGNITGIIKYMSKGIRVVSLLALLFLLYQSYSYLQQFLNDTRFDNVYITKDLMALDLRIYESNSKADRLMPLTKWERKEFVASKQMMLTRHEAVSLLFGITSFALYFVAIALLIYMDYLIFKALDILREYSDFKVNYGSRLFVNFSIGLKTRKNLHMFPKKPEPDGYDFQEDFSTAQCEINTHPLDVESVLVIALLLFITLLTTLFQAYAQRLRHRICAVFFPENQHQRIAALYNEIMRGRHQLAVDIMERVNQIRRNNRLKEAKASCLRVGRKAKGHMGTCLRLPQKCFACARNVECFGGTAANDDECPNETCETVYFCKHCRMIIGKDADTRTCVCTMGRRRMLSQKSYEDSVASVSIGS